MADTAPFCPYVGLRPFHEEDKPYFFGRESDIRSITNNLFGARLTILYGASGVGKSSILMAGVVPELRKEPRTAVVVYRSWQVPQATTEFKRQIIVAVNEAVGHELAIDENFPLDELLKRAAEELDGTVLMLLDQFEEYFLYFPDPGPEGGFDVELAHAMTRRDVDAGFLISVREDSISRLDRFRRWVPALFSNPQRLFHLGRVGATRAIEKPLAVYNEQRPEAAGHPVTIEPVLVQALLDQTSAGQVSIAQAGGAGQTADAGESGSRAEVDRIEAPYLQLVLERLWAEEMSAGSQTLRIDTLTRLGGANTIVRTHLDQVMERLDARDQELCARVFDRLVTPSGAKVACRLRDLADWAGDLEGEVPRVTRLLEDNRLLAKIPAPPGHSQEDDQYQIFHDVLAQGILDWRTRFLQQKEKEAAAAAAAEQERSAAEERRRSDEAAARERELRVMEQRAEEEAKRADYERRRAQQEKILRKRFQYAMFGLMFALACAGVFAYRAWRESNLAQTARQNAVYEADAAKKAQAALELEKVNEAYAKTRDLKTALEGLQKVLVLNPDLAAAYESRGRVLLDRSLAPGKREEQAKDITSAIADFEQALKLNPDAPVRVNTLVALAAAHQSQGDIKQALANYDDAIKAASSDANIPPGQLAQLYLSRGTLRESLGLKDGALADYSEAIKLQPYFDDAYLARGQLYDAANDREKAVDDLRLAFKYANDDRTQTVAQARLKRLGEAPSAAATSQTLIYIQIVDPKNKDAASAVQRELEKQGYKVAGIEAVPKARTTGDVRYLTAGYQATAERVARVVETVLAREGYQVKMRTFELDAKKFTDAKPGVLEVWIPPLSRAVLQVPSKLY